MSSELYLITGATGYTGKYTVDELLRSGKRVRAFVTREDARSKALADKGAEIHVGDLLDFDSVRQAVEGVTAAYFVIRIEAALTQATMVFAQAAKEAGLQVIVNMSQISARREAKSHAAFNHWLCERVFDWSGTPTIHIRPTFFAQWLLYPFIIEGNKKGLVEFGWSTGRHAPIAAEDQARFISAVIQNPAPHIGKIYPLFGPKEYTAEELYAEVSRVLGREVKYRTLPEKEFTQLLTSQRDIFAQHMVEVVRDHTNGVFSGTDHIIEEVTGQPPMGVEEFVRKNWDAFRVS
jgi:NAD(P)H dehydrogenase (quinone)